MDQQQLAGPEQFDAVVVGAGFGGLACALALADAGARVVLCEALTYAGGCASTFRRGGYAFETGATLFGGFGPGGLYTQWIDRYGLDVTVTQMDPLVEVRTPTWTLPIGPDRNTVVERLVALDPARAGQIRAYLRTQERVADALWPLFDDPARLPPLGAAALAWHARRSPAYLSVLPHIGRPLGALLTRLGLETPGPLRTLLDAVCQITVQCGAMEAEAPMALSAADYFFRGTGHVHGGIGRLADALVQAIRARGGVVYLGERVRGLRRLPAGAWEVTTRHRRLVATRVAANVLPSALDALLDPDDRSTPARPIAALQDQLDQGWSACMWYLAVQDHEGLPRQARHYTLIDDPAAPLVAGNHVFCSLSAAAETDRGPAGTRTITVSTHVSLAALAAQPAQTRAAYVDQIQARMQQTIAARAPALLDGLVLQLPASPRTWERFTRRPQGAVGGVPRRAGLHHYQHMGPQQVAPGLYLVGDSTFPGQSTLAVSLGGVATARAMEAGTDGLWMPWRAPGWPRALPAPTAPTATRPAC